MSIKKQLEKRLKELHLPTILKVYEEEIELCARESLGCDSFLLNILEKECEVRWNNRILKLLRESRLPLEKNFETFDRKRLPPRLNYQLNIILEGNFIDHHENILAFGNPGSGKTHLLSAICQELIRKQGRKVLYINTSNLVQELLLAKRDLELPHFIKKLGQYEILLIDDLGYVQQSREEMEVLFTLLADRYERGSVLITSNLPFSKWEAIFKDPMTTAAAIDRLVHHSIILELNIPSFRMEQAKKSKATNKTNETKETSTIDQNSEPEEA